MSDQIENERVVRSDLDRVAAAFGPAKRGAPAYRELTKTLEGRLGETGSATLRSLASDLAWDLRERRVPPPDPDVLAAVEEPTEWLFLTYVCGQMLRYDFRFRALEAFSSGALEQASDDALLLSLNGLALAGLERPEAAVQLADATASSNSDRRSWHCALHGYWLATHLNDQADRLLDLSSRIIEVHGPDANAYFRRAYALRRIGLERRSQAVLSEALNAMATAFELSDSGPEVNQDYVRERELIALARMFLHSLGEPVPPNGKA